MDVPAAVTQEEGRPGFLHLPSVVLALIFLARRVQPFLSLVDREVEILCTNDLIIVLHFCSAFILFYFLLRKNPSSYDDTEIRTHVPTSEGFEVTN